MPLHTFRSPVGRFARRSKGSRPRSIHEWPSCGLALTALALLGCPAWEALGQTPTKPAGDQARRVPETLNFANGLFRDRRYEMAAAEYERFLADAKPGPDAIEGRYGLANARLFQGDYTKARRAFEDFLRQAPDHPNAGTAWYRIGETSYMLGDLPAARRAFETYTTKYPGHKHFETAWPYLGDVCLRGNDLPGARRAYEASLSAYPEGRLADRARFGLGRALALQGEPDKALEVFDALALRGGKDWADRAWFQIGQAQAQANRPAKAVEAFEKVEEVSPQSSLLGESRLHRAEALLKLDRRDEAELLLRALVAEAPSNLAAQAAFALGTARLERGDAKGALEGLDEAAGRFATSPMASAITFRSAEAAQKLGDLDDARTRFLRAAEADPDDPWADDALLRASRIALDQRDAKGASELIARFLSRFPNSPLRADARLVAARAALADGVPKEAVKLLTASLAEDNPSRATAEAQRYYLGLAYRADGQTAKANEVLDALANTPAAAIAADAQFMVGQGQIEAKKYAEAIPALEKYLAAKPKGEVADFALAHLVQAHLELGRPDAAAQALAKLAESFPESKALAPTRVRVAEAALASKKYDEAAKLFQEVAEADSTDPALGARARLGLGWARLDSGKPAEAAEAFAAFLKARPDDPLAPEAALARGRALEAANQPGPALEAYAHVVGKYPSAEPAGLAKLATARLLASAGRPAEAAESYADYIREQDGSKPKAKDGPGLDNALAEWGWALIDAEKPAEADAVFARLLKEFPESPRTADARFNLAESANQSREFDKVVTLLVPLVATGSKASPRVLQSALYRLGRTFAEQKEWAKARGVIDRLLKEFPESPLRRESRLLGAEVALEAGDAAAADASLAELLTEPAGSSDPEGFPRAVKRRRVQSLLALKKWDAVVEMADALKAEKTDDPRIVEVDYAKGRALQHLALWDDARACYKDVIDARKGGDLVARAQLMIGETYFHQKDYHEAIRQFLKVDILHDAPTWQAAALLEAGKAYERLAQWADAAETYERLRAKFPGDPNAEEAGPLLEAARRKAGGEGGRVAGGTGDGRS